MVHLKVFYIIHFSIKKKVYQNVFTSSILSIDIIATIFAIKKLIFSFRLCNHNFGMLGIAWKMLGTFICTLMLIF